MWLCAVGGEGGLHWLQHAVLCYAMLCFTLAGEVIVCKLGCAWLGVGWVARIIVALQ